MKFLFTILGMLGLVAAQPVVCSTSAAPVLLRAEGLSERIGDIIYSCTGAPNSTLNVNLSVQLNTAITNRLSSGTTVTGTILTVDSGAGPQAVTVQPVLLSQNNLIWNGVSLMFSPQGTLAIQFADIRADAAGIAPGGQIVAILSMSSGSVGINQSSLLVGVPETGLYVGYSQQLICAQNGSALPGTIGFSALIQQGTAFATTRVTEGFASAFTPKAASANLNADSGTRIIIHYSGFPQGARLFVPSIVAGSDAVQPTAGGDLGLPPSGGAYAPSSNGSLLLALVPNADASGVGGSPPFTPSGSGTTSFDSVTELTLANGAAYAVYEVVDANNAAMETAQFPTFLGLGANAVQTATQTGETVTFAPVSNVAIASTTAPIPRFLAVLPLSDCGVVGDCGATYFPQITVNAGSLQFSLAAGAPNQARYIPVINTGGGVLNWAASITYTTGSGWLAIQPAAGQNNGTIRGDAYPGNLTAGTYQATITVDGGAAGRRMVAITLVIAPTTAPGPQIGSVVNAASFAKVPVVPGSLLTILGSSLTGKNVSASFDGIPATILFSNATQINLLVPASLGAKTSSQLVVTVDAASSLPVTVQVAPFEPGIFAGAVLNQDSTVNSITNPAAAGSVIYFYATGLSGPGMITARIGSTELTNLYYAGPAPGFPGVQQVNLVLPPGVSGITTALSVCGTSVGVEVCSLPYPLSVK